MTWPDSQIAPFTGFLLTECGLADNTLLAYRRDLKRFSLFCAESHITDPAALTAPLIQDYIRSLSVEGLSTATVARHLASLRMFMRYHILTRQIDEDVCSAIESPKKWQTIPKVLNKGHVVSLIDAVDPDSPLYLRDRAMIELLYATGMRASELADLRIEDVNITVGFLRCIGKGRKERVIPVYALALERVGDYLGQLRPTLLPEGRNDPGTVFLSRTGRALCRIDVWRIIKRTALRAGLIGHVSPHTLRHCFGTHLLQGGADLRSVQEMLGHADVSTTQIYTHVDNEHLRSVHKKYHPRA